MAKATTTLPVIYIWLQMRMILILIAAKVQSHALLSKTYSKKIDFTPATPRAIELT